MKLTYGKSTHFVATTTVVKLKHGNSCMRDCNNQWVRGVVWKEGKCMELLVVR